MFYAKLCVRDTYGQDVCLIRLLLSLTRASRRRVV
jgi:hypothetical protein